MRNYQTKANEGGVADSITSTHLGAGEANSFLDELENAVTSSDQSLAPSDGTGEVSDQLAKALAVYGAGGAEYTVDTGAVNAYVLAPVSPKKAIPAYFDGMTLTFKPGNDNTGAATVNYNSLGVKSITNLSGGALAGGEITGIVTIRYNLSDDRFEINVTVGTDDLPGNYITGLTMENDSGDTDHDISVSAGECKDSTDSIDIELSSAMVKRIDAAWVAGTGNGGLFSGAVTADTWYHVFAIIKDSDSSVDVGFDISITAANIPSGYTKYRRIGSVLTDASANIIQFYQNGDWFLWHSTPKDIDTTLTAGTSSLLTLSTPADVRCHVLFNSYIGNASGTAEVFFTSPDVSDDAVNAAVGRSQIPNITGVGETAYGTGGILMWSNTSSQVRVSAVTVANITTFVVGTTGYMDLRGKE